MISKRDRIAATVAQALEMAGNGVPNEQIAKRLRLKKATLLARLRRGGYEYVAPPGYWRRKADAEPVEGRND